jgi:xylose isomerase
MDTFALGLKAAAKLIEEGLIDKFIEERYSSYKEGIGKKITEGNITFEELEEYIIDKEKIENKSGKQEYLEVIVNQVILSVI